MPGNPGHAATDAQSISFAARLLRAQLTGLKLFADVLDSYDENSEDDFADIVKAAIENRFSPGELALKFKVSASTISRWKEGRSCPHPYARKVIVGEIKNMIVSAFADKSNIFPQIIDQQIYQ